MRFDFSLDVDCRSTQCTIKCITVSCVVCLAGADPLARDPRRGLTAVQWAHLCSWPACARVLQAHAMAHDTGLRVDPAPVPNSVIVTRSAVTTNGACGFETDLQAGPDRSPGSKMNTEGDSESVETWLGADNSTDCVLERDAVKDSVPDQDSEYAPSDASGPIPESEPAPERGDCLESRLLQWFSESDLTQEPVWLRERHAALTGGGAPRRRASLPDRPDIYREVEPATWRTAVEVPAIRVREVEAPVDPVIVQYGDPVPPDQRAVQQNKVSSAQNITVRSSNI